MNYPKDKRGRYIRIPIPLKREKKLNSFIERHKKFIGWYKRKLHLSDYELLWAIFFKGMLTAFLIERFIFH